MFKRIHNNSRINNYKQITILTKLRISDILIPSLSITIRSYNIKNNTYREKILQTRSF